MVDLLREEGYVVEAVEHGAQALKSMYEQRPDTVILDMVLPVMDGPSFLEACRANPEFADIPILLYSATPTTAGDAERLGARAYLPKPFGVDTLLEVVSRLVAN
jgi:CheY-like chemotaxis protein